MKKTINPLLYPLKSKQRLFVNTQNISHVTNRLICSQQALKKNRIRDFVNRQMRDYPIKKLISKDKVHLKDFFAQNLQLFRKTKGAIITRLTKEIAMSANYLSVEEAREIMKTMNCGDIQTCRGQLGMLLTTLKQQLRKMQLESFQEESIHLLIHEISEAQDSSLY